MSDNECLRPFATAWLVTVDGPASRGTLWQWQALNAAVPGSRVEWRPVGRGERRGPFERLYRWLDGLAFPVRDLDSAGRHSGAGSSRSTVLEPLMLSAGMAPGPPGGRTWRVTYEGLPADRLEEAVRRRLGVPGGTVQAEVWLEEEGGRRCLFRARCVLDHRSLGRSVQWVAAKLPSLLRAASQRLADSPPGGESAEPAQQPGLGAARLIARLAFRAVRKLWSREQWFIQLHDWDGRRLGARRAIVEPPANAFWADPFLCRQGDQWWLLFESLRTDQRKADLAAAPIDANTGAVGPVQPMLNEGWHLSYPFVLKEGGTIRMIPESSANQSIDLYRCTHWPDRWEREQSLVTGARFADASVIAYRGRWWMFASHGAPSASLYDELHIFHADRLEGPWLPHALNPVKIDAVTARPAGAPWVHEGVLYRPVQDCSDVYGGAVRIQQIVELSEARFLENDSGLLAVPGLAAGTRFHTLNQGEKLAVIDVLREVPRIASWGRM